MRRLLAGLSLGAFLVLPVAAFAIAASPSALLRHMDFRGNPHAMEAELHVRQQGLGIAVWMKGAAEGKTPLAAKAWLNVTVDIAQQGSFLRVRSALRLAGGNLYGKILSVEGTIDGAMSNLEEWTQKPWFKIALPEEDMDHATMMAAVSAGMHAIDESVKEEDIQTLMDAVVDALFTMESTRYKEGTAYSLKLAPGYLSRVMEAIRTSPLGQELSLVDALEDLPMQPPINLHIRTNMNGIGELVFMKWYAATEHNGMSVVAQGTSQWQGHPVNVEIPKNAVPFGENLPELGMPDWPMPMDDAWDMDEWSDDEEDEDEDLMEEMRPSRQEPSKSMRWSTGCSAEPGTPAFLQESRKGICNLPPRDAYRVHDRSRNKMLNPRTTRLKHPHSAH
jgi:hypothetical protein